MEEDLSDENTPTEKTQERYKSTYDSFIKWQESNGWDSFDEDAVLAYFNDASKTYKSSTLKSMYSILKRMLGEQNNIDISTYSRVLNFLKEHHTGYERVRTKIFTAEEINRFLVEAPDEDYLAMKAIMVFGVTGGCRCEELMNIKMDHVKDCLTELIVTTPRNRKNVPKMFLISGTYAKIVQKYAQLRPAKVTTDRFFIQYSQGECENRVFSRKKIGMVPKEIAKFLKLDDYKSYTGYSFEPANNGRKKRKRLWGRQCYENPLIPSDTSKQLPNPTKRDSSKRLIAVPTNTNFNVENVIVKSECEEMVVPVAAGDIFYDLPTLDQHKTEASNEPIVPMLPATVALMKRKSKYYLGLQPNHFLSLLQLVGETKQISDVKLMLVLRKLRLNEVFEVLADAFDLDETTAEKWYDESKHAVLDLVDGQAKSKLTAPTASNRFNVLPEPTIKIEKCESLYPPDPIAVETDDDSTSDINGADDYDDFECTLPETGDDQGFLSADMRKRTAECTVCHKFFYPRLLNSHMNSVHFNIDKLNLTICGLCWHEFRTEALLKAHQKDAHGGGSYGCDICGKIFRSKRYIEVHILSKHACVKTFLCDTCGDGFPTPYMLLDHNKKKHNEPGHACHLCDMRFMTAMSLKDHIVARHTDDRPYKCEVKGCGKSFSWPSSFASHRRVHVSNDKFECSVCLKRFSFKGNLRNHLKTFHPEVVDNRCLSSNFV